MCRFIAYLGAPLLLTDLLYRPTNSLIMQSYRAREREEPLNGDGFGVGWYAQEIDPVPCVQRYVTPAWSNRNLQNLAAKTRAANLFAHVRAATPGMVVMEANVHPFAYDRFMWMHNGSAAGFNRFRRSLRESLKDEFYDMIQGTTDSEHAFALFLGNLQVPFGVAAPHDLRRALVMTIARLNELSGEKGITEISFYNFAVTNGSTTVVSRYATGDGTKAPSLHYSRGLKFECLPDGTCDMHAVDSDAKAAAVIVSSERLNDVKEDWTEVPVNHTVSVLPDLSVKIEKIEQ